MGHNGTTYLDCADLVTGVAETDGYWEGTVWRYCYGGILGPLQGFCTPLNCTASTDELCVGAVTRATTPHRTACACQPVFVVATVK